MLNIKVSGLRQYSRQTAKQISDLIERVSLDVINVARAKTPIRLGRARNGWKRIKQGRNYSVQNRVVYIDKLEQGSSKQAPRGIIGPTIKEISRRKY